MEQSKNRCSGCNSIQIEEKPLTSNAILGYSDTMAEATVEEIASFISGNVKRKQILDVLEKNGSMTFDNIRKLTRTPKIMLEKTLENMEVRGVVIKQNNVFTLTENGKKAVNALPGQSNKSSGHRFDANIRREI